jgi:hypothetical protein
MGPVLLSIRRLGSRALPVRIGSFGAGGASAKIIPEWAIIANPMASDFVFRGMIATRYLDRGRVRFLEQGGGRWAA